MAESSHLSQVFDRLGAVERDQVRLTTEMGQIKSELADVAAGVKQLLADMQRRPDSLTWKTVVVTVISLGSCIASLWVGFAFLLSASPDVRDLSQRMRDLDRDAYGRVPVLERRISELEAALAARPGDNPGRVIVRRRQKAAD